MNISNKTSVEGFQRNMVDMNYNSTAKSESYFTTPYLGPYTGLYLGHRWTPHVEQTHAPEKAIIVTTATSHRFKNDSSNETVKSSNYRLTVYPDTDYARMKRYAIITAGNFYNNIIYNNICCVGREVHQQKQIKDNITQSMG
ncbi:unnamed protein product [Dracunculus medinensis]|uniref:Astacin domain-containing protein n=1 Tax=Dracunculus medinensis TaxID=318479 RepID=A0A0N4UDM4_DRAME|nr:unnamed protein product [Dracunculus medinensis]